MGHKGIKYITAYERKETNPKCEIFFGQLTHFSNKSITWKRKSEMQTDLD